MLIIENLTHVYANGVKALDEVSLTIPAACTACWARTARASRP
jgi:ABC-type phosphate/phosphonate transport system ATPase subunit